MQGPICGGADRYRRIYRRRELLKGTLSLKDMAGGGMTALLGLATAAPPACGDLSVYHDIIATALAEKGRSIFQHESEFDRYSLCAPPHTAECAGSHLMVAWS